MNKIAFLDVKPFEKKYLEHVLSKQINYKFYSQTLDEIDKDKLEDVEVVSIFTSSNANKNNLEKLNNLKMINTRSTGVDHIDTDYCKKRNIVVKNVPSYGQTTVAEYTFALIGNLIRKISVSYDDLKVGKHDTNRYLGSNLANKTLGIIGTGTIGSYVAKLANAYSMNILAFDPKPKLEIVEKYNVNYVSLEELYKDSDIITIHCPYTNKNYHMIDQNAFNQMKDGVYIINTARGELIDTTALLKSLKNNKVAGAALDVLESEKIIKRSGEYTIKYDQINKKDLVNTLLNHELINMENVIVTPHSAYETNEAIHEILDTTVDDVKKYLNNDLK